MPRDTPQRSVVQPIRRAPICREHRRQVGTIVATDHFREILAAKIQHVLAGSLLRGIPQQLAREQDRVHRIDQNQPKHSMRRSQRHSAGNCTAPVVPHQDAVVMGKRLDQSDDVLDQRLDAVVFDLARLVGLVDAPSVDGNDVIPVTEVAHLRPPCEPCLGEPMDEQHQRTLRIPAFSVMQRYAIGVHTPMADFLIVRFLFHHLIP